MAIYWLDAQSATNGDGSYASPWNGSVAQPIANGDEVRIKSHSIAAMTDLTFTGDYTYAGSVYIHQIRNCSSVAGISAGDVIMYDGDRTVGRVTTVGADYIQFYAQASCPVFTESVTAGTFRKLNRAYTDTYTATSQWIQPSAYITSTYSDGWYSETQRVTDQSYMTIFSNMPSRSNYSMEIKNRAVGSVLNLENSCIIGPGDGGADYSRIMIDNFVGSTFKVHQQNFVNTSGQFYTNASTKDSTFTWKYLQGYYGPFSPSPKRFDNCTININVVKQYTGYFQSAYFKNNTIINIDKMLMYSPTGSLLFYGSGAVGSYTLTLGECIMAASYSPQGIIKDVSNDNRLILPSGFTMWRANGNTPKATQITNLSYLIYNTAQRYSSSTDLTGVSNIVTNNSSLTTTALMYTYRYTSNAEASGNRSGTYSVLPFDAVYTYKSTDGVQFENSFTKGTSTLMVDSDTDTVEEFISTEHSYAPSSFCLKVTKDNVAYHTTSPSMKGYLPTYAPASHNSEPFYKVFNVPLAGDGLTQYTISCWIKSDAGFFDQGNLVAQMTGNGTLTESAVNIASAEAGFTQVTVNVTPQNSYMYQFKIKALPKAGSKNFWISDVEVL